ncbi:hypothetical protein GGD81_003927 [Rhodobium orientis]|uniref:EF-hand domain-containing protein n=1 Tax=Rhodobium orientis TaxID=34017 RepID=A0A327JLM5_9HYPH|nr:hypothetical protein [Rhodobium orientis]MBB4304862.1 hypothetical protein [Rhodobium orientis]MBK5949191.1 hypothetical protein [Rhodobium orientis]RAI27360.1 hypothetical protein CH339_10505 [Rhodobium orientis]
MAMLNGAIRFGGPAIVAAMLLLAPGAAAEEYDGTPDDRFTIVETATGILRIDKETGNVSTCREKVSGGWTCQIAADERAAYEAEIDRLSAENKALADRLAEIRRRLEALGDEADRNKDKTLSRDELMRFFTNPPELSETDEKAVKEALDVTEKAFRGFLGVMREIERDLKSDDAKTDKGAE